MKRTLSVYINGMLGIVNIHHFVFKSGKEMYDSIITMLNYGVIIIQKK